jgi:hypothetical protein
MAEFLALANRRAAIRAEIAAYAGQVRAIQAEALEPIFEANGVDLSCFPPWAVMMVIESISRLLMIDRSLGITAGHDELITFVERYLRRIEPPDDPRGPGDKPCYGYRRECGERGSCGERRA